MTLEIWFLLSEFRKGKYTLIPFTSKPHDMSQCGSWIQPGIYALQWVTIQSDDRSVPMAVAVPCRAGLVVGAARSGRALPVPQRWAALGTQPRVFGAGQPAARVQVRRVTRVRSRPGTGRAGAEGQVFWGWGAGMEWDGLEFVGLCVMGWDDGVMGWRGRCVPMWSAVLV